MEDFRPKVLEYINRNGPVLPVQIAKCLEKNLILTGAIMSELVQTGKLRVSSAKIGGSPVYYLTGQEYKLSILYNHLREKERKAYDLLKEKKILRDNKLEPWQRVALRDLKDFAVMIKVDNEGSEEIFWRWYLTREDEFGSLLKTIFEVKKEIVEPEIKKEEIVAKQEEPKLEVQEVIKEEKPKIKKIKIQKPVLNILSYFNRKKIEVLEEKLIRKDRDWEFIVNIMSEIGKIKFFVKVKDRARVSDQDLIVAQSLSSSKNLPLLFISNGELTKKGKEYCEKNHIFFDKIS